MDSIKINRVFFILSIISLFITNELIYLFFNNTISPDFVTYSSYFNYFFRDFDTITREQGLFYFFVQSLFAKYNYSNFELDYNILFLHKSTLQANILFYIYGLLGYFLLLRKIGASKKNIYITFIFLNFFPLTFALRMTLKPEIVAFAFLPWIIYLIEMFLDSRKLKFLIFSVPYIAILSTSKASIFIICFLFLGFFYAFKILKTNLKLFIIFTFTSIVSIGLLTFENSKAGNLNLFNIASGSAENFEVDAARYDNKADFSLAYKIDMFKLATSPIKDVHKDSFISITLLDTFGDYFGLYWNNNASLFFKDRLEIIELEKSNLIKGPKLDSLNKKIIFYVQNESDLYLRQTISLILGIGFYFLLVKNIFSNKKYRKFYLAPFFGSIVILIHVISGFPKNNFDPLKGDTLKPYYYSFLVCLALVFLVIQLLENNKKFVFFLVPYIFFILILIGFPKNLDNQIDYLIYKSSESALCEIDNIFLLNKFNSDYCTNYQNIENKKEYELYENRLNIPIINLIFIILVFLSNFKLLYDSNYLEDKRKKLPFKIKNKTNK